MKKRFLSVFIILCMVLAMTPTVALAATEITSIEISGITSPVDGRYADYDYDIPSGAGYKKVDAPDDARWVETKFKPESLDALRGFGWYGSDNVGSYVFYDGNYYTFIAALKAEEGRDFATNVTATIDGKPANVKLTNNGAYDIYLVWCTFYVEALTPIEELEILDVTAPAVGEEASFNYTLPQSANYTKYSGTLFDEGNWVETDNEPGGYGDIVNGEWYRENSGDKLEFKYGKYYTFVANIAPKDGYGVEFDTPASINGSTAAVWDRNSGYGVYKIWYTFYLDIPLDSIEVSGVTVPEVGAEADFDYTIPNNSGYSKDEPYIAYWVESTQKPTTYSELNDEDWYSYDDPIKFEAGYYYTFVACLASNRGYEFTSQTSAAINGNSAGLDQYDGNQYDVWYTFEVSDAGAAYVNSVTVTDVTVPKLGELANFDYSIPSNADYSKGSGFDSNSYWVWTEEKPESYEDVSNGNWYYEGEELQFIEGLYYTCVVSLNINEGHMFDYPVSATLNGQTAGSYRYSPGYLDVWYTFSVDEDAEDLPVDKLEVTDVVAPVVGEDAEFTYKVPDDAHYGQYEAGDDYWVVTDIKPTSYTDLESAEQYYGSDDENLKFEDGKFYTFVARLMIDNGYLLAPDGTATMNGKDANFEGLGDNIYEVWYTFEASDDIDDNPNNNPNDQPNDGTNDQPNDGTNDQPSDGPNDQPNDGPTDQPSDESNDQIVPTDKPADTTPKTGDESNMAMYMALLLLAGTAGAVVYRKREQ